jgi:hypothetical protein
VFLDEPVGVRYEDGLLKVRLKGGLKRFFACGDCDGRQLDWMIRVTPGGAIEDLGLTTVTPELDLIDELLDRVAHGLPTAELASNGVVSAIARSAPDADADRRMLFDHAVARAGDERTLCLFAEGFGPYRFTIRSVAGRLRATDVEDVHTCR